MKKQLFTILLAAAFVACGDGNKKAAEEKEAAKAESGAETYKVDTEASTVQWVGKKISGQHTGTVNIKSGELKVSAGTIQAGTFVMDMRTIKDVDLTDTAKNNKLTRHLRSADFFHVDSFPQSSFEITEVKAKSHKGYTHEISGNLSIKGISKNISFPATIEINGDVLNAKGTMIFNRADYNVRYGSGRFFSGLADNAIDDDVELQIKLAAKKE